MIKSILKTSLIISMFLAFGGCKKNKYLKSAYLETKDCEYSLYSLQDSLYLDYFLYFDSSTFELADIDTSRISLFQSSYFDWHVDYIAYQLFLENASFNNIKISWKNDSLLDNTLFVIDKNQNILLSEYENSLHQEFIQYMIDSISVEDYFLLNKLLYDLFKAYQDPNLSCNYAFLIHQYEKFQCGKSSEHISFEIFMLLNIGIKLSILDSTKQNKLLEHNSFYIKHCLPPIDSVDTRFNFLKLNLE